MPGRACRSAASRRIDPRHWSRPRWTAPLPAATVADRQRAEPRGRPQYADRPGHRAPAVELLPGGAPDLRVARGSPPTGWRPGTGPLPVLMDPYGGPHAQRVLRSQGAFREAQWFADQGFAVVVVDGRGTPGCAWRGSAPSGFDLAERSAGGPGDRAARRRPRLPRPRPESGGDPRLVVRWGTCRPWSRACADPTSSTPLWPGHPSPTGGCTTRATPSGTSVCWLSTPGAAYRPLQPCSTTPPGLTRPLLLIDGFADDNVFVANTLQLGERSSPPAGRPHSLLPLSGVTHMAAQEEGGGEPAPAAGGVPASVMGIAQA